MQYRVAESFLSFQGEGLFAGRKAFFIRLFGCNVKCPWCDSKYAWSNTARESASADELAERAAAAGAEMAVITGGEPCLQDLRGLVAALRAAKIAAHLETSGTLEMPDVDWVALSPKLFCPPLGENVARADELKMIVSSPDELEKYAEIAESAQRAQALWLEPEWSKSGDKHLLAAISDFVISRGGKYRCGWQMHKNYFVR